jgi:ATP-dependent Clp protease ATP-binding subunit ClpA
LFYVVRILDTALIEAAQLSHRYVTNRLLPAKAIGKYFFGNFENQI